MFLSVGGNRRDGREGGGREGETEEGGENEIGVLKGCVMSSDR